MPARGAGGGLPHAGLDHVAVVVPDTGQALRFWQDALGLDVLRQEVVNGGSVRLSQLDLGGAQLQLVEPLPPHHPLRAFLERQGGPALHHLCLRAPELDRAVAWARAAGLLSAGTALHQGTRGQRAVFLDSAATGVTLELTGP